MCDDEYVDLFSEEDLIYQDCPLGKDCCDRHPNSEIEFPEDCPDWWSCKRQKLDQQNFDQLTLLDEEV